MALKLMILIGNKINEVEMKGKSDIFMVLTGANMLKEHIEFEGKFYDLICDNNQEDMVVLTYENRPAKEASYLLAVCGKTLEDASISMQRHLKLANVI